MSNAASLFGFVSKLNQSNLERQVKMREARAFAHLPEMLKGRLSTSVTGAKRAVVRQGRLNASVSGT